MSAVKVGAASRLWCVPACFLAIGLSLSAGAPSAAYAADIPRDRGAGILAEFRQADNQITSLFSGVAIAVDIGGRATMFTQKDGVRYAATAFPVRGNIKPERIGTPYCRGHLLTPERRVYEEELSQKVADSLVATHLFKIWRSRGRIEAAKTLTQKIPDTGYAVTLCRVRDEAVTSAPVTLTASEITAAQVAIADAAFTDSDFETAARRYHNLYQATNDAALLVMEVISLLESGSLDAAFERDEDLQPRLDEVADADLLDRYEDAMAKAINAYMSVTP